MAIARTREIAPRHQKKRRTQRGGSFFETIAKLDTKALTSTGILKKGLGIGVRALNSDRKKTDRQKNKTRTQVIQARNIKKPEHEKPFESDVANYVDQEAKKEAVKNLFG